MNDSQMAIVSLLLNWIAIIKEQKTVFGNTAYTGLFLT